MYLRQLLTALFMLPLLLMQGATARAQDYDYDYYDEGYYNAPQGNADMDVSMFYDALAPHGDWFYTPEYGYVWMPYQAYNGNWRPYYNDGHWVWTDYGWMWVSDYEWGWAPFHYGRWVQLDGYYWVWLPDVVWGPAWVAWRYTDTYAGWSPLPPGAYWYPGYGLEISVTIPVSYWIFVPGTRILDPYVYRYGVPRGRTERIYYGSRASTSYRVVSGTPVCVGVDVHYVSRWVRAPIRPVHVSVTTSVGRSYVRGGSVTIYRPPHRAVSVHRYSAPPPPRRQAPASLSRMTAPPPPSRAGVAPSQQYRTRATYERQAVERYNYTNPATQRRNDIQRERNDVKREQREIQQDRYEIRDDRREIQREKQELRDDRQQLRNDARTQPQNKEQLRQDANEVRDSRQEVNRAQQERGQDRRELRNDQSDRRRERHDVQRERTERR